MTTDTLKVDPSAIVCEAATLTGDVTIQEGTVVHPQATILATAGPVVIGPRCIIEEMVVIENTNDDGAPLVIGADNHFEVGAVVRARSVGVRSFFGAKSLVGPGVDVGDSCSIGTRCSVLHKSALAPCTVVWGKDNTRRTMAMEMQAPSSILEHDASRLPRYHRLKKSKDSA